jgi:hypothetical protein
MARSDGFHSKLEKTRILPLRCIGNICGAYAGNHLVKCFDYDEEGKLGFAYKYHSIMYTILNKPYELWGTYYTLDSKAWLDEIKKNVAGQNWDDYDEDGIAYWEKVTDSESEDS